jgi:hypothetical protein
MECVTRILDSCASLCTLIMRISQILIIPVLVTTILPVFHSNSRFLGHISSECRAGLRLLSRNALLSRECWIRLAVISSKVRHSCAPTPNVADSGRLSSGSGNANNARDTQCAANRAPHRTAPTGPEWTAVQTHDWEPWLLCVRL